MGIFSNIGNSIKASILQKEGETLYNDWQVVRQNIEYMNYEQQNNLAAGCLAVRFDAWQKMKNMTKVGIAQTAVSLKQDGLKLRNLDVLQSTCYWLVGGWMQSYFGETEYHQRVHEHMSNLIETWRLRLSVDQQYRGNPPAWLNPLQ